MSAPLRILYVHNSADIYGASRCLVRLIDRLDRSRFEAVVVLPEEGPLHAMLERAGAKIIMHPGLSAITRGVFKSWRVIPFVFGIPMSALFLLRVIREERISLVHTNTGVMISPPLAALVARVPHIWHIRDWFGEFKPIWKFYSAYIVGLSCRVLNVSNAIAGQFPASPKVCVVHDGFTLEEFDVDSAALKREFRQNWGMSQDECVVGVVGRIKWVRKGQEHLVRAIGVLKTRGVMVRGLIVGTPFPGNEDHLVNLRKLAAELGVIEQLVFTGELADPRAAYAAMDVFVLPSAQPEPFGGVVMEAMAMERPVVATRLGGSLDQVADGESGFLVEPANAVDLADKLMVLVNDAALRERMGRAGRERIATKFTLDGMVAQIVQHYEECLS